MLLILVGMSFRAVQKGKSLGLNLTTEESFCVYTSILPEIIVYIAEEII